MTTRAVGKTNAVSASEDERDGVAAIRTHGVVLGRVCMALLGDAAAAERALERVASEAGAARWSELAEDVLPRLLGMARLACATQLSKLPIRTVVPRRDLERGSAHAARLRLGLLRPTEREAVVLHMVGGLDVAQVAAACGVDIDTARARIARAVSQLMEEEKKR